MLKGQIRKPYWGVLARDLNPQTIHKPENLLSLIQVQSQAIDVAQVPSRGGVIPALVRDRVPGKQKSNRLLKDLPL